jgi:anti-anti-sigma factor
MADAELRARGCGDPDVVTLRGDLDAVAAASFADAVLAAAGGCVIADLAAAEFTGCCALGALARVQKLARRAGSDVLLAGPREPVRRLPDLAGLSGVFSIHASGLPLLRAGDLRGIVPGSRRSEPHRREGSLVKRRDRLMSAPGRSRAVLRDARIPAVARHRARG